MKSIWLYNSGKTNIWNERSLHHLVACNIHCLKLLYLSIESNSYLSISSYKVSKEFFNLNLYFNLDLLSIDFEAQDFLQISIKVQKSDIDVYFFYSLFILLPCFTIILLYNQCRFFHAVALLSKLGWKSEMKNKTLSVARNFIHRLSIYILILCFLYCFLNINI